MHSTPLYGYVLHLSKQNVSLSQKTVFSKHIFIVIGFQTLERILLLFLLVFVLFSQKVQSVLKTKVAFAEKLKTTST